MCTKNKNGGLPAVITSSSFVKELFDSADLKEVLHVVFHLVPSKDFHKTQITGRVPSALNLKIVKIYLRRCIRTNSLHMKLIDVSFIMLNHKMTQTGCKYKKKRNKKQTWIDRDGIEKLHLLCSEGPSLS